MDWSPFIVIEVLLVFGGAIAFGWWQLRDLDREKAKREQERARAAAATRQDPPEGA